MGAPPNYAHLRSPRGPRRGRVYIGRGYPAMGGPAAEAWRGIVEAWRGIVGGRMLRLYMGGRERVSV